MKDANSSTTLEILVAEDHGIVREGVESVIANLSGFTLVRSVGTGTEALVAVADHAPDILILDLHLPDISGLEVLRRLRATGSELAVLVLTSTDSDHTIRQALALGARGYCVKSAGADALALAIQTVAQGKRYLSAEASEQLLEHIDSPTLNAREVAILQLASLGLTNRQIGSELELSERTIKFHLNGIFEKLGVSDRTAAVVTAMRRGIINL